MTGCGGARQIQFSNSQDNIVIASVAKQSTPRKERVDCFVAFAPRNDAKIQLRVPATQCARVVLEIAAPETKGAGNAGRSMHPQPRVQNVKHTSVVATGP